METFFRSECGQTLGPYNSVAEANRLGGQHERQCLGCNARSASKLGFYGVGRVPATSESMDLATHMADLATSGHSKTPLYDTLQKEIERQYALMTHPTFMYQAPSKEPVASALGISEAGQAVERSYSNLLPVAVDLGKQDRPTEVPLYRYQCAAGRWVGYTDARDCVKAAILHEKTCECCNVRGLRCQNANCKTPTQNVAQRWCQGLDDNGMKTGATLELSCEPCHLLDEADWAERTPSAPGMLTIASAPERMRRRPFVPSIDDYDLLPDADP